MYCILGQSKVLYTVQYIFLSTVLYSIYFYPLSQGIDTTSTNNNQLHINYKNITATKKATKKPHTFKE